MKRFCEAGGFTVAELLVGVLVTAMIGLALGSLATTVVKSYEQFQSLDGATRTSSLGLDFLHEDVVAAIAIRDLTPDTSVHFELVRWNRTGTETEIVRYRWSGASGDPLERRVNGGGAINVLGSLNRFNIRFVSATRTSYRLDNESTPLTFYVDAPVYQFSQSRSGYKSALGTSTGSDSRAGAITIGSGGYRLATLGGNHSGADTVPIGNASEISFSWNLPQDTKGLSQVSFWMRFPTTTGTFTESFAAGDSWIVAGNTRGIWTFGDDPADGFLGPVLRPNVLFDSPDSTAQILHRATERFRAWMATFEVFAFDFDGLQLLFDDLTVGFSQWTEKPSPGAGWFIRENRPGDPFDWAVCTDRYNDTPTGFLIPSGLTESGVGDYQASFRFWTPYPWTNFFHIPRGDESLHYYESDFEGQPIGAAPATWGTAGVLQDFAIGAHEGLRGLSDVRRNGTAIFKNHKQPIGWGDTVQLDAEIAVASGGEEIFVVLYSPEPLYAVVADGQTPAGSIVAGLVPGPSGTVRMQAYLGRGLTAPDQVGVPLTVPGWEVDGDARKIRLIFHRGTLHLYDLQTGVPVLVGSRTGFATVAPVVSNYYGLLTRLSLLGGGKWFIEEMAVSVSRLKPNYGLECHPGAVFADDFEADTFAGLGLPYGPGWVLEYTDSSYFDIVSAGLSKSLGYGGSGSRDSNVPIYVSLPAWNSDLADTQALEIQLQRGNRNVPGLTVVLAAPAILPSDRSAVRNTKSVRMVNIRTAGNTIYFKPVWGIDSGTAEGSEYGASHNKNESDVYRFEMRGRDLRLFKKGALVNTWINVFPDSILAAAVGWDGTDPSGDISFGHVRVYQSTNSKGCERASTYQVARYRDERNHYRVRFFPENGTSRWIWAAAERVVSGVVTQIGSAVRVAAADESETMKLSMSGHLLSLEGPLGKLNQNMGSSISEGLMGLGSATGEARYDEIEIRKLRGDAGILVRYQNDTNYVALEESVSSSDVDLRIVQVKKGTRTILAEVRSAFRTEIVTPLRIELSPNDTVAVSADTGGGFRRILSAALDSSLPSGFFGYAAGLAQVNYDSLQVTSNSTYSAAIEVAVERIHDDHTHLEGKSDPVYTSDLSDTWELHTFYFPLKLLPSGAETYLFRLRASSDSTIGTVTADIMTFLPVRYGGSALDLDENSATYGASWAESAWNLYYGIHTGFRIPFADMAFVLWDEVEAETNGRKIRPDRFIGGITYEAEIDYFGEKVSFVGGEMSAGAR